MDNVDAYGRKCLKRHAKMHPSAKHVALKLGPETEEDLMKEINVVAATSEHLHLHGSPPCQDFSQANTKRPRESERKNLSKWFVSFARRVKKECRERKVHFTASMENVVGCATYVGEENMRTLSSEMFGCATKRKRTIWAEGWDFRELKKTRGPSPKEVILVFFLFFCVG